MSKTKILDLIRKVLNKSQNNPSEEEAATALLMAQRLALKHGIDMSEVEDFAPGAQSDIVQVEMDATGNMPYWHITLAVMLAKNFRVRVWRKASTDRALRKSCIVFFGETRDVEIASEIYKHSLRIIPAMATAYLETQYQKVPEHFRQQHKGKNKETILRLASHNYYSSAHGIKVSYCRGFVSGMDEKFKEQVKSCGMELMVLPSAKVEEAYAAKEQGMKRHRISQKRILGECYRAGLQDGKNYELNNKLIGG